MRLSKIILALLLGTVAVDGVMADDFVGPRNRCNAQSDKLWDEDSKACIPEDPCSSSNTGIKNAYCVNSIEDINPAANGIEYRAYGKRKGSDTPCDVFNKNHGESQKEASFCTSVGVYEGGWAVKFFYGTVKGRSECTYFENTEDVVWCRCKSDALYTFMRDARPKMSFDVSSSLDFWHEADTFYDYTECESSCPRICADKVLKDADFRSMMFFHK